MNTPLDIFGVSGPPGAKVIAVVYLPAGLVLPVGVTVTGGTAGGPVALAAGDSMIYVGLPEGKPGVYGASVTCGGALPGSAGADAGRVYMAEAREVDPATNMAAYAGFAAAFNASSETLAPRQVPENWGDGYLSGGSWFVTSGAATGSGDVPVDHNGGNTVTVNGAASVADVLRVLETGTEAPINDAEIVAYTLADYDAGLTDAPHRRGTARTGEDGRWLNPLMLAAGSYKIVLNARTEEARTVDIVIA